MIDSIVNGAYAVVAIGLLIFIHELGHFLVAKKVGIRVEAFALGFGPKVVGFTRGDTVYKICAIPLGGYVKMAGELGGEGTTGAPDEFSSKTIGQRAWVVSAGVIMNVFFAMLLFPLAFSVGVPFDAAVVGYADPTMPAWKADIRPGDVIREINGTELLGFEDITNELAFAKRSVPAKLRIERDGQTLERNVTPHYQPEIGISIIGVQRTYTNWTLKEDDYSRSIGLAPDDEIVTVNGRPTTYMANPEESDFLEIEKPLALEVRRKDGRVETVSVPVTATKEYDARKYRIGIEFAFNVVDALATAPDAATVRPAVAFGLKKGDRIVEVGGKATFSRHEIATALRTHGAESLTIGVERDGAVTKLGPVPWSRAAAEDLLHGVAFTNAGRRFRVTPGGVAEKAGLRNDDQIVAIDGKKLGEAKGGEAIAAIQEAVQKSAGKPVALTVRRGEADVELSVQPERIRYNAFFDHLAAVKSRRVEARVPFPRSIPVGLHQAWNQAKNILVFLRSLVTGQVSSKNVGGIIFIAKASYTFAEEGLGRILFFMGILSLNLAFLNILPIPLLDGGHLLFLIIEKIKGGPVSDRTKEIASWIGLIFILGLVLLSTFNDIVRFFVR